MTFDKLDVVNGEPHAGAESTARGRPPASSKRRATAGLSALAVGALVLLAACGTVTSTDPSASATPTQSATAASSPSQSSSGNGSSGNGSSGNGSSGNGTSTGSSGGVTASPANSMQLAQFTTAAQGQCGFSSSSDTLTNAKVTNNGWGSATITARNPQAQGNASMIFQLGTTWTYDTCGSSFDSGTIPQDVLTALGL